MLTNTHKSKLTRLPQLTYIKLLLCFSVSAAPSISHAKEWAFDVFLDKSKIGQHTFTLEQNKLISIAKLNVKILFIEAYAYHHKATEQWKDGCLSTLETHTIENKTIDDVKGQLSNNGFVVDDGKTTQTLPLCSMTFAYWNPKILSQAQLLNPQNADWLDIKVNKIGNETITIKAQQTDTVHYKLEGSLAGKPKLKIDLWYTVNANEWVALKSTTPEGYIINYVLR